MIPAAAPAFGETVMVLCSAAVRDVYGNDVPGPVLEHPVHGCAVAPASGPGPGQSGELTTGRDTITEQLLVYPPPGADIRPTDRLRIRGLDYEVHGPVHDYRSPLTGTRAGAEVTARRVTG
ncbi:hypothetical protein [Streptomyces luteireticuli]|uniref:Head-tail adaptor protein n=1 Tax=Streptomyces luteireticuli TaxID=173858 RepID=A0ABP3IT29_9ACTN